jgi:hypothetical protein
MTNNKQQTEINAVEWFAKQMEILHYDYWAEHISKDEKNQRLKQLKEQAKAMHKEEHFNTWWHSISENEPISFDQYYNETYGNDKQ